MRLFRRKTYEVLAVQVTSAWFGEDPPEIPDGVILIKRGQYAIAGYDGPHAHIGDWIVTDQGRIRTCRAEDFERLYEPVGEPRKSGRAKKKWAAGTAS